MNTEVSMRIVGHELIVMKERQETTDDVGQAVFETVEIDMLRVKLRGIGADKKTVCTLILDPSRAADLPLGDNGELRFEIRQQRMKLEGAGTS